MIQIENFDKEKLIINIVWANVFGILILIPIVLLFGLPYFMVWGNDFTIESLKVFINGLTPSLVAIYIALALLIMIIGIVIHELIHGVLWANYAKKGFKSIKFGIIMKMLTPYCHCKEPLKVKHYIVGAIMPAIILGIIPAIISIIIGNIRANSYFNI